MLYTLALNLDSFISSASSALPTKLLNSSTNHALLTSMRWSAWGFYFYWQSIAFASLWCLGHEAGHGTLSDYSWLNTLLGFVLHTVCIDPTASVTIYGAKIRGQYSQLFIQFLLIPYFSWRSSHHAHHVSLPIDFLLALASDHVAKSFLGVGTLSAYHMAVP